MMSNLEDLFKQDQNDAALRELSVFMVRLFLAFMAQGLTEKQAAILAVAFIRFDLTTTPP